MVFLLKDKQTIFRPIPFSKSTFRLIIPLIITLNIQFLGNVIARLYSPTEWIIHLHCVVHGFTVNSTRTLRFEIRPMIVPFDLNRRPSFMLG